MSWHQIWDILSNSCLITGLVLVMMLMIEYINVSTSGKWFARLGKHKTGQVLLGSLLGLIPGCIGGFASVSLYSHGLISIGALVATMIASSGDEAFMMLAIIPRYAFILFGVLLVLSFICGLLTDLIYKGRPAVSACLTGFDIHGEMAGKFPSMFRLSSYRVSGKFRKERIITVVLLGAFIAAVFSGILGHEHAGHEMQPAGSTLNLNILDEKWLNIIFAVLSIFVLLRTLTAPEHFIKEHIWNHIIKKHALSIFLWTTGALAVIGIGLQYIHIEEWLKDNTFYLILLAALVGLIPESGPHFIFITLFASGAVPFSVLLASSMSQDGHTSLPLLAEDKKSFVMAKLINAAFAITIGSVAMLLGF